MLDTTIFQVESDLQSFADLPHLRSPHNQSASIAALIPRSCKGASAGLRGPAQGHRSVQDYEALHRGNCRSTRQRSARLQLQLQDYEALHTHRGNCMSMRQRSAGLQLQLQDCRAPSSALQADGALGVPLP